MLLHLAVEFEAVEDLHEGVALEFVIFVLEFVVSPGNFGRVHGFFLEDAFNLDMGQNSFLPQGHLHPRAPEIHLRRHFLEEPSAPHDPVFLPARLELSFLKIFLTESLRAEDFMRRSPNLIHRKGDGFGIGCERVG